MRRWTQIFTCQNKKSLVEPNSSDSVAQQKSRGPAKMKELPRLRNLQVSESNDQKMMKGDFWTLKCVGCLLCSCHTCGNNKGILFS